MRNEPQYWKLTVSWFENAKKRNEQGREQDLNRNTSPETSSNRWSNCLTSQTITSTIEHPFQLHSILEAKTKRTAKIFVIYFEYEIKAEAKINWNLFFNIDELRWNQKNENQNQKTKPPESCVLFLSLPPNLCLCDYVPFLLCFILFFVSFLFRGEVGSDAKRWQRWLAVGERDRLILYTCCWRVWAEMKKGYERQLTLWGGGDGCRCLGMLG